MALVQTSISFVEFKNAFIAFNRADNFSLEGLRVLYEYFEDQEENIEFDVIAICCDYVQASIDEIINDYNVNIDEDQDKKEAVRDYLENETIIIGETSQGFVFASF